MDRLRQDVRFALRSLRRDAWFAGVAVLSLALGIGAATAVFTVVDGVLLTEPPYREPDRLALVWHRLERAGVERARISGPDVAELREASRAFEGFAFVSGASDVVLQGTDRPAHLRVGVASPNLFSLLGVGALHGRIFRPDEARVPAAALQDTSFVAPPTALLLEHATWRDRFGGDPGVVGRTVRLSGTPATIVGVLPPEFELWLPPDAGVPREVGAWTPVRVALAELRRADGLRDQDSDNTGAVVGRLAGGAALADARAEMETIAARRRVDVRFYEEAGMRIDVEPLRKDAVRAARPLLLALSGAVGLVLLIVCLNVAGLSLARGSARRRELAVRSALGADRPRLVRQLLTESALLAAIGAAAGVLLARWGVDALLALGPAGVPGAGAARLDAGALAFAVGTAALATLLFGLAPALRVSERAERADSARLRAGEGRTVSGGFGPRRALVVVEVALCLVLLVGAGLLARSLGGLLRVDPGFDTSGLHTFRVTLPGGSIGGPAERAAFMRRLEDAVREIPGVREVGVTGGLPLSGTVWRQPWGAGDAPPAGWGPDEANFRVVTSGYFAAMGIRVLAGRGFTRDEDLAEERRIAVVDERLARRVAPEGDAVGRTLAFPLDGDPVRATIVGIVEGVRHADLREPGRETLYVPYRQEASRTVTVAVRTEGPAAGFEPRVREIVAGLPADVAVPAYRFRDMEAYVADALRPTRFALTVLGLFAIVGLVLAVGGLYAVLSYAVSHRRREIGVRLALGARGADVERIIVADGLRLTAAGLLVGLGLAVVGSPALRALLYGVGPLEPLAYGAPVLLLATVAGLACWIPARRAARVDPSRALQPE